MFGMAVLDRALGGTAGTRRRGGNKNLMEVLKMAEVLTATKDMDREEWLEWRRKGIGGSDAAVVLGLSPWRSRLDLWLEKTGQFVEEEDNEAMYWGRVLEDIVAAEFSKRTGLKVRRRNAILQHPEYSFMLANIDRLIVGEKAGLECKTTSAFKADDWEDQIPEYYYCQVQHYMAVTGFNEWWLAVLIGGNRFVFKKVTRDNDFIQELIEEESKFWHLVETETLPELDGSDASSEAVKRMYPEAEDGTEVQLPHEAFELIQQYDQACEEEKAVKERKEAAANQLKQLLGNNERGFIHDRKVIWSNVVSKRFDSKAFQKEQPELYQKYLNESAYRRFQIK